MSPRTPSTGYPSTTATFYSAAIAGNEQSLIQERLLLAAIIEEAQDAILSSTLDGIITTWNHAAARLFGYSSEEIIGMPNSLFIPPADLIEDEILVEYLCQGNFPAPFQTTRRHKSGALLPVTLTLSPVKNAVGEVVGISTIARNMAAPRQIVQDLKQESKWPETQRAGGNSSRQETTLPTTDNLTYLKNHRVFQERLRSELGQAQREEAPLSILLIDIDRFQAYNERYGHHAGDTILKRFAEVLKATARSTEMAARYGGSKFAILLPETDIGGAKVIAKRFQAAINATGWEHRSVTASFGIATACSHPTTPTVLIALAESALARSKERGSNQLTHAADQIMQERDPDGIVIQHLERLQTDSPTLAAEALKQSLRASYDSTVASWSRILDMRDKETEGHNRRVTSLMVRLAKHVGMDEEEALYAKWGAQLHDIGKMAIPDEILHKRGPLDVEEWVEIRRHPGIAYEMLAPIAFVGSAIDVAYCHHEKWDGTGYPRALRGSAIPYAARLFAVIDVYDALCSDRSYREGWSEQRVREYLQTQAGSHFDPKVVEAFLEMLELQEEENYKVQMPARYIAFA